MSEAPERIYAAPPSDDREWKSGAGEWDASRYWTADGATEYVRADRIEELEVYSNGLVEELRSRTRRLEQERDLALAQVDRLLQLSNSIDDDFENFVAKSTDVDLIEQAISDVLSEGGTYRDAAEYVARTTLAELKGEK